jgi:hypothetical protein
MNQRPGYSLNPLQIRIPQRDRGWIYAVRWGDTVKVGKTRDRNLRRLREAQTWCPGEIDEIIAKPFWNIARLERSLHTALAEHWQHGEWFKFNQPYWLELFLDGLRQFRDNEESRDSNSIDFPSWLSRSNYAEIIAARYQHQMTLRKWLQCRGEPWTFSRDTRYEEMMRPPGPEDEALLKWAEANAWRDENDITVKAP